MVTSSSKIFQFNLFWDWTVPLKKKKKKNDSIKTKYVNALDANRTQIFRNPVSKRSERAQFLARYTRYRYCTCRCLRKMSKRRLNGSLGTGWTIRYCIPSTSRYQFCQTAVDPWNRVRFESDNSDNSAVTIGKMSFRLMPLCSCRLVAVIL